MKKMRHTSIETNFEIIHRKFQIKRISVDFKFIISIIFGLLELQRYHQIEKNMSFHNMCEVQLLH